MNPLQVGAAVGALVATGMWCIAVALQRAPRSLDAVRRRMYGGPAGEQRSASTAGWAGAIARGPAGRWVEHRFGVGLEIAGLGSLAVVSRVLTSAGIVLFATLGAVAALIAVGALPLSPLWPVVALSCAVLAGWVVIHDVGSRVAGQRKALRRASNDFVQLVAVGLTTDQSVEEAVRFALSVGAGDAFEMIRAEVEAAPQRGIAVWESLDEFGRRVGVRELGELAASVERQGLQGVSISDTVASLAESMRAKALDELEREADRANANLAGPTIGFVVSTIVFLAYPLAQRIGEAFGG